MKRAQALPIDGVVIVSLDIPVIEGVLVVTDATRLPDASSRVRPDLQLDDLVREWISIRRPRPHTIVTMRLAVRTFKSLIGDVPVADIGHRELFDFRDMLSVIPNCRTTAENATPLEDIYPSWLAEVGDRPRLLPTSIRQPAQ